MGDTKTVVGLLAYADKRFSPVLRKGAYSYHHNDDLTDRDANGILCDPIVGNSLLPLARLN